MKIGYMQKFHYYPPVGLYCSFRQNTLRLAEYSLLNISKKSTNVKKSKFTQDSKAFFVIFRNIKIFCNYDKIKKKTSEVLK